MRVTVKSNVYFNRLKRKKVPKLIFEELLKPLGRAALEKVKKATKNGVDINGESYADYTENYKKWLKKAGFGEDKPRNMQLRGNLKNSIPMKIFTNEEANRVLIAPSRTLARNSSGDFYPAHHLYENSNNREKGTRKWFFTDEELPTLLTDAKLLGNVFKFAKNNLENKLEKELKGKMRIIAGKKIKF